MKEFTLLVMAIAIVANIIGFAYTSKHPVQTKGSMQVNRVREYCEELKF